MINIFVIKLSEPIRALGAWLPFDDKADFSFIDNQNRLVVSKVIHQATVEVNEEGAEAAAATAVIMTERCIVRVDEPINFICNRPFLFIIHEKAKNTILFYGKYAKTQ